MECKIIKKTIFKLYICAKNMHNFTSKRVLYSICFRLWVRGYGEMP